MRARRVIRSGIFELKAYIEMISTINAVSLCNFDSLIKLKNFMIKNFINIIDNYVIKKEANYKVNRQQINMNWVINIIDQIYMKYRKQNLHKMKEIPVCEIPNELK